MDLNFEQLHLFIEGMKISREAHSEENKSYEYGLNGRLYSNNGSLSYSSIKGTVEIYNNPNIKKYLGYFSFPDQLVLFVKYTKRVDNIALEVTQSIFGNNITISIPFGNDSYNLTNELSAGALEQYNTSLGYVPLAELPSLNQNYETTVVVKPIDLSLYYSSGDNNFANYEICEMSSEDFSIINNKDYSDAIIVLTKDSYSSFSDKLIWWGNMNWDINRKIVTVGIDENAYYKRVYFSENLNPFRVLNLKDPRLSYRLPDEFNVTQNAAMLQPVIKKIDNNGSIKAMAVQYAYRLITENGQLTQFSPYSEMLYILKDKTGIDMAGGSVSEITNNSVLIECSILNLNYKEIQAIAIEYEADTIPTAIRNLGKKSIANNVEFLHTGTESEFNDNITIDDILQNSTNWKYCSDLTVKNNKLIVGGIRNEPLNIQNKYFEDLFLFKSWDINGLSHSTLINPNPEVYKYINPSMTDELIKLEKQLYKDFLFFGNAQLTLNNKLDPSKKFSIEIVNSKDKYTSYLKEIREWLLSLSLIDFPNLEIVPINDNILFKRLDENIKTDLANYYFTSTTNQTIIDFENQFDTIDNPQQSSGDLLVGAQSVGFNKGVGVRVTFEEVKEKVLTKSPEVYESGDLLKLPTISLNKTFVKGEIYRLALTTFKNGNPYFATVLGDVRTPDFSEYIKEIDSNGNLIEREGERYVNQSDYQDSLYAHSLQMRVEVRIPCELRKIIDSYQIQYVERTENNRTVLAQGLSAPLVRLIDWEHTSQAGIAYAPDVYNKWTLPFNGGPLYSNLGLKNYTDNKEDYNTEVNNLGLLNYRTRIARREMVNRKAFYFDSPDLIYGRISDKKLTNAKVEVIGRLRTDHTHDLIRSRASKDTLDTHPKYTEETVVPEIFKPFSYSRKLKAKTIGGQDKLTPYTMNISIFSECQEMFNRILEIDKVSELILKGQIIPGSIFGSKFEFSNNALTLYAPDGYNSSIWMGAVETTIPTSRIYASTLANSSNKSAGYPTVIIKTKEDLFSNDFVGNLYSSPIKSHCHFEDGQIWYDINGNSVKYFGQIDVHALINLRLNNADSIYGGRSKYAYSQNIFIPLSKVIPISTNADNRSQIFKVQGDFYTSLFLRVKNDMTESLPYKQERIYNDSAGSHGGQDDEAVNRSSAWAYGVILETEVECRLTNDYQFFRENGTINFNVPINEFLNSAYFKKNNLRIYGSTPYNFKDEPLMLSTLSASKVKLNGDYYDAWTVFPINEFYELDRIKGSITNVTTFKDEIFTIQEFETNQVNIDTQDFVTTQSGDNVAVKKGDGRTFTNHKKISDFGTSIRRALAEGEFGFSFFDEYNKVFVKFAEPISLSQEIQDKLHELFKEDKITDTEGYYDAEYKETNIRIRTEKGNTYMLSYNELLKCFNGWISYDNDIYIVHDQRVFAPVYKGDTVTIYTPVITSQLEIWYQVGTYLEYHIEATENPTSFNVVGLPLDFTFDNRLGLIYGTSTAVGTHEVTITVNNGLESEEVTLIIHVVEPKLEATITGRSTTIGTLSGIGSLIGESDGIATVNAFIGAYANIEGEISCTSTAEAEPSYLVAINANDVSLATSVGALTQPFTYGSYSGQYTGTSDSKLLIYGSFTSPDAQLVKVNTCGSIDETFAANITGVGGNYIFSASGIIEAYDGSYYLHGYFTSVNGIARGFFAKLNKDGTVNTSFNTNPGFNDFTTYALIDFDGSVYVTGRFTSYKGGTRNQLVKLDQTGAVITSFVNRNFGTTAIQVLEAGYGQIWVHGYFGGNIRLINKSDGSLDPKFDYGGGFDNAWNDKPMQAVTDGDKLVLISPYGISTWKGVPMASRNIVRIDRNGNEDTTFNVGTGFTIGGGWYIIKDGDKFVITTGGGIEPPWYAEFNGVLVPYVIRLNNDGTLDNTFNFNGYAPRGSYDGPITKIGDYYYVTQAISSTEFHVLKIDMSGNTEVLMPLASCELPVINKLKATVYSFTRTSAIPKLQAISRGVATVTGTIIGKVMISGLSASPASVTDRAMIQALEGYTLLPYSTGIMFAQQKSGAYYPSNYDGPSVVTSFIMLIIPNGNPDYRFRGGIQAQNNGYVWIYSNEIYQAKDITQPTYVRFTFTGVPVLNPNTTNNFFAMAVEEPHIVADASNRLNIGVLTQDLYPYYMAGSTINDQGNSDNTKEPVFFINEPLGSSLIKGFGSLKGTGSIQGTSNGVATTSALLGPLSITMSSTSISSTWSPSTVINSGEVLEWTVSGGVTIAKTIDNDPTFDFSGNTGIANILIEKVNDLIIINIGALNLTSLDVSKAINLVTLQCHNNVTLSTLNIASNKLLNNLACHGNFHAPSVTDQIFIDLDANGVSYGTLHIRNNRTSASNTAFSNLIAKEWSIYAYYVE